MIEGSVCFDRAAEYYDRTRGRSDEATTRMIDAIVPQLIARGRSLEIGVGTGQLALPLRAAGVRVFGIDISEGMIRQLLHKAGTQKVPLAFADATRIPFEDGSFGSIYFRWVLHLIPDWRRSMEEAIRVVGRGGFVAGMLGGHGGRQGEIRVKVCELLGVSPDPVGLGWSDTATLDEHMASLGCELRLVSAATQEGTERLDSYLDQVADGQYSWTWSMPQDLRRDAVAAARAWAEARWGTLDRELPYSFDSAWRVYDVA